MYWNAYMAIYQFYKSVINRRTKEKPTPRGGFFFGYMMEDSNRGSYTRRKPRARHVFLVHYLKRNAVSCQARHSSFLPSEPECGGSDGF